MWTQGTLLENQAISNAYLAMNMRALEQSWQPDIGNTLKAAAAVPVSTDTTWLRGQASTWPRDDMPTQEEGLQNKNRKDRRSKRRNVLLIATHLNELQEEEPDKIVIVRKINRLGFDSADILKEYFESFGPVKKVRLSNAHAKQPGNSFRFRVRPSGIGFLLFENAEDATRALAAGESQTIAGVEVFVRGFERRQGDSNSSNGDEMHEMDRTVSEEVACNDEEEGKINRAATW